MRILLLLALLVATSACARLPKVFRDRDPLSADEHARLGASYEVQGEIPAAEAQYRRAVALDPNHAGAWMALGNRAFEAKDYKKARRYFLRVLRIAPRHPGASNNLAMVYLAQDRRLDEAERLAQDALAQGGATRPYVLDTLEKIVRRRSEIDAMK